MRIKGAEDSTLLSASGLVDRADARPLHRQVYEWLLIAINDGLFTANGKLPSERVLMGQFDVSRITIRHAIRELIQQGVITSQPGKGLYVASERRGFELEVLKSFTSTALSNGRTPGSRLIEAKILKAPLEISRPLHIPLGSEIVALSRLRLLDGVPVVIQTDWIAASRVPGITELDWTSANRSLYAELRERYRIRPVSGHTTLSARIATKEEATTLNLDRPAAVLTVDQIAFDRENRPINLTALIHHPQLYPLTLAQSESGEIKQY